VNEPLECCILVFGESLEFIHAKVERNVKQKEGQEKSFPPRNYVVGCAERFSWSLPDRSVMPRAMLRWVASSL
jgi:hypothetical protein